MYNAFNEHCARIHELNKRWWQDPATGNSILRNRYEMLALVHSELSEALEGERKGAMDDHLPERPQAEVEMADVLIRLLDYCGGWHYDMDAAFRRAHPLFVEKTFSNALRYFHQRFFCRAGAKGEQIDILHMAVAKVSELEHAGSSSDNIALALSWVFALLFDYCAVWDYDLIGATRDKLEYNKRRKDHTPEARLAAGGKAF